MKYRLSFLIISFTIISLAFSFFYSFTFQAHAEQLLPPACKGAAFCYCPPSHPTWGDSCYYPNVGQSKGPNEDCRIGNSCPGTHWDTCTCSGGAVAVCGNGACESGETSVNCSADCASAGPPPNGACGSCTSCGAASSSECALINGVCSKAGYCGGGAVSPPYCGNYSPNCGFSYGGVCNNSGSAGPPYSCIACYATQPNTPWVSIGNFQYANCTNSICGAAGPPGKPVWKNSIPAGINPGATITPGTYYPFFVAPGGNVATKYLLYIDDHSVGAANSYEFAQEVTGGEIQYQNPRGWPFTYNANRDFDMIVYTEADGLPGCNSSPLILSFTTKVNPTLTLTANPMTVAPGGSSTLTWTTSNVDACTASVGWSGLKPLNGSEVSTNITTARTFTMVCNRAAGGSAIQSVTVNVTQPAPTLTLTANPTSVNSGGSSTLTWLGTNVTSCTASGGWAGAKTASGSQVVSGITATTTYTLNCTGPGGNVSRNVTVTLNAPPPAAPTLTFSGTPTTIAPGGSTTLTWSTTNATSCTATVGWTGAKAVSGTQAITGISTTKTYTLTCTGPGGSISRNVVVTVNQPVPTVLLTANPTSVSSGGSSTLTWSSTNSTSCTASGGWSGAKAVSGSQAISGISASTTYTITCTGPGGSTATSATVSVVGAPPVAPTLNFSANPTTVNSGGSSTLTWSTTGASSCTASGGWSGAKAVSGTQVITNITATKTYTLNCTGPGGNVSRSVTVTVAAPPAAPTVTITASPTTVASGASSTITWSSTNATSCTAGNGWSGAKATSGSQFANNITGTTTFSLTCTGPGGSTTNSVTVSVVGAPPTAPTTLLNANPTTVNSGGSSTLTWSSTNTTSCTASGGWSGAKAVSGTQVISPITAATTFLISCTGPGGTALDNKTVSLTAPAAPTVTLTATPTTISSPSTVTLAWSTTNAISCTASGGWAGAKATSGSQLIPNVSLTTAFTLTCLNSAGVSASVTRTVTFVAAACGLPTPNDPPSSTCAASAAALTPIDWSWPAVTNADSYFFEIRDQANTVIVARTATPRLASTLGCAGGGTCTVTTALPIGTYHSIVWAHSTTAACTPDSQPGQSNPFVLDVCKSTITSTVQGDIGSTAKLIGGACTMSSPSTTYTAGGTVDVTNGGMIYTGTVNGSGQYTVSAVPNGNNYSLTLNLPTGSPYFCTCPLGCTYNAKTVPLTPNLVFFTSPVVENWFQTIGGDVAALNAGGVSVKDPIPVNACNGGSGCNPLFSIPQTAGKPETGGALIVNSGALQAVTDSQNGFPNNISTQSHYIRESKQPVIRESYDYLYKLFGMGLTPSNNDFTTGSQSQLDAKKPSGNPDQGRSAYYSNGNLTVNSDWNVGAGQSFVIFVNGNLTINKEIKLSKGGFVAFIVKGNILITKDVGTSTFTQTTGGQVQGMYFADGSLTVESTKDLTIADKKFIGEGTFAAKSGIALPRDFRNGANGPENNAGPASLFIYRPDLIQNAPEKMKASTFTWKEVSP